MKVLMINVVCGIRSTGRICTDLAAALESRGHEVRIAYGREEVPEKYRKYAVRIGNNNDVNLHAVKARMLDASGFGSKSATLKFIRWVQAYDPDVIHLHNIHGYYINIEVLFEYLKTCNKKIIWTLHDCWPFTGHAAYCEASGCERWITGCHDCPNIRDYPLSLFDRSKNNWARKKELFLNIPHMIIVTPSVWLADLVKKSFLEEYRVVTVHNGIDTSVFSKKKSDDQETNRKNNKKIVLGVAAKWDKRKGLDDFIKLSQLLSDEYQIVLVGVSDEEQKNLPETIRAIRRTNSTEELARLYSSAYVYVNPTYEDNYPTTNLEAIACGTPVITYRTGGSPESAELYGCSVPKGAIKEIAEKIQGVESYKAPDESAIAQIDVKAMVSKYLEYYY